MSTKDNSRSYAILDITHASCRNVRKPGILLQRQPSYTVVLRASTGLRTQHSGQSHPDGRSDNRPVRSITGGSTGDLCQSPELRRRRVGCSPAQASRTLGTTPSLHAEDCRLGGRGVPRTKHLKDAFNTISKTIKTALSSQRRERPTSPCPAEQVPADTSDSPQDQPEPSPSPRLRVEESAEPSSSPGSDVCLSEAQLDAWANAVISEFEDNYTETL